MSFAAYNFVPNPVSNSSIGTNNLTPYFQRPNIYLYIYVCMYVCIMCVYVRIKRIKKYEFCDTNFRSVIKWCLCVCVYCCTFKLCG